MVAALCLPAICISAPLENFYLLYFSVPVRTNADPAFSTPYPPQVRSFASPYAGQVDSIGLFQWLETSASSPTIVKFFGPRRWHDATFCKTEFTAVPKSFTPGAQIVEANRWRYSVQPFENCDPDSNFGFSLAPIRWTLEDKISFNTPVRRTALDGGEFDASPMVIERAGNPWITYYWGYKLGLVESQSDWNDANRSKMPSDWPVFPAAEDNFKLTTLPPPWVEGEVTEYVNTADFPKQPDGQYFYAATDEDRAALDAVPAWQRSGNRFKHGGYVSVCRFYGGKNGGPNTHFYSASDSECNWLKGFSFLSYEGQTFRVNLPLPLAANAPPGTQPNCPAGSIPLSRLYNNAGAPGKTYVSNHRYVTTRSAVDAAVTKGWLDEGTVMCVPQ